MTYELLNQYLNDLDLLQALRLTFPIVVLPMLVYILILFRWMRAS